MNDIMKKSLLRESEISGLKTIDRKRYEIDFNENQISLTIAKYNIEIFNGVLIEINLRLKTKFTPEVATTEEVIDIVSDSKEDIFQNSLISKSG